MMNELPPASSTYTACRPVISLNGKILAVTSARLPSGADSVMRSATAVVRPVSMVKAPVSSVVTWVILPLYQAYTGGTFWPHVKVPFM